MDSSEAVEKLREIWTPGREVEEISADIAPQTELDSMIRHILHAVVQQGGRAIQISIDELNTGTLRWEQATIEAMPGRSGGRVLTVWVEE